MFNEYLDSVIDNDNSVRIIDLYIDKLDLKKLDFKLPKLKTGKPPYRPQLLLKIYTYGYLEKIRSSRKLEKECKRNMELIWLTENLAPDFKTIADFRKNNTKALKNVFKEFMYFCKAAQLISLSVVGIDGTKMRAQNSLNNIYHREEMEKIEKRIEEKIAEYLAQIESVDKSDAEELRLKNGETVETLVKKFDKLNKYQDKVKGIKEIFEKDPELKTYFANDEDSRFQSDKGKVRAGYNPQIAVDDKNKIIVASEVTNKSNDQEQMSPMIEKVEKIKKELNITEDTDAVMDAGYYSEKEIMENKDKEGIKPIVSTPEEAKKENSKRKNNHKKDTVPAKGYELKDFIYNEESDKYFCPEGEELYKVNEKVKMVNGRPIFNYRCRSCANCGKRNFCTNNKGGRSIQVSGNKKEIDKFVEDMQSEKNMHLKKKRKEIVEHPFGTIKRNLGFTYFMQTGIENVKAEFSFICFTYNFKRVL
ncbi:MAG: IS1182 family transposase, partial [Bacteroidales bacterium]|nr:IS1182 family transposase [Bacteroidales bacterium]